MIKNVKENYINGHMMIEKLQYVGYAMRLIFMINLYGLAPHVILDLIIMEKSIEMKMKIIKI